MTKEELAQEIAQGNYRDCRQESEYSITFKIGDIPASVSRHGNKCTALTIITTEISEEDYNKILRQTLRNELEITHARVMELKERINAL